MILHEKLTRQRTVELALPDEGGHGRCGHDGLLAHENLFDAVGCSQLDDDLGGLLVVVAPIPAQADGLALGLLPQRVEQGLDPVQAACQPQASKQDTLNADISLGHAR